MATRILVVEDDDMLAEGLQFALRKEGYAPDRAASVQDAEARWAAAEAARAPYALLLLDVLLPDGSGFALCRRIREASAVPILFLTACDDEVNIMQGLELGGDDYVAKPFRVGELMARIKANLRRANESAAGDGGRGTASFGGGGAAEPGGTAVLGSGAAGPDGEAALGSGVADRGATGLGGAGTSAVVLASAGIAADLASARVTRHGRPVELTGVEYKLLTLFLRHPGQTLTRDQLCERLWEANGGFVDDNTLSVYIRRLREKLEDDPSAPALIGTVRGIGYRWLGEGGAR